MGSRMAANVARRGHQLLLYDVVERRYQHLLSETVQGAASVGELAARASVVLTMLPSPSAVRAVYLQELVPALSTAASASGASLCIDSSTVDPETARSIARAFQTLPRQVGFLDAPVSGGVVGAEQATLTFMVGGPSSVLDQAAPLLQCMGKSVLHCGEEPGSGAIAKICNNMALGIQMLSICEALSLGRRLGMPPDKLSAVLNVSSARCWSSDTYNPAPGVVKGVPAENDYEDGFVCDLMRKDLGLALLAAGRAQTSVPMAERAAELFNRMSAMGYGAKDFSGAYRYLYARGHAVPDVECDDRE